MVSGQQHAPAALYPGKDPVPVVQEAGWDPGPVWTGGKSRPNRDSMPDHPAHSSVAIPTELPGPLSNMVLACNFLHMPVLIRSSRLLRPQSALVNLICPACNYF